MNENLTIPRGLLDTDATTLWVYAKLLALADEKGRATIDATLWWFEIGVAQYQFTKSIQWLAEHRLISTSAIGLDTHIIILSQAKQTLPIPKADTPAFVDPRFADIFREWLDYKEQQFKFKYKSERSLKAAYTELVRLSCGDPEMAMRIVEQSMSNGWKGLFEIKNSNGTRQITNATDRYAAERETNRRRVDNGLRAAMDVIARENGL